MTNDKFRSLTGMTWEEAATLSNRLFFEADKLDEKALLLIRNLSDEPAVWTEYAATRRAAKIKRAEARREWLRITNILNSLDPKSGRPESDTVH